MSSDECYNIFGYEPNKPLAIAAASLWGVLSTVMLIQTIRGRNTYFLIVAISGLVEMGGYIGRRFAADHPCSTPLYIVATLLTLVPPTCLAMGNYTLLSKVVQSTGYVHPFFTPGRVKWMFLIADCFCLLLQSSGGGLTASSSSFNTGKSIILVGLAAVLCVFIFFLFLVCYVQIAVYKNHKHDIRKWWPIFVAFYLSMVMIIIRSCYRVAEFKGPLHNPISLSEPTFYACDTLALLIFMIIWIVFHPSRINFENLNGALPPGTPGTLGKISPSTTDEDLA
eukprot:Phypoly_transcript_14038.p1 GENE.Phypoly_transcript_14038~~Phypoly_transcript_14038.p1  ORF type:complete len:281 (+),score=33.60 Phypoly_transcript_14038:152-994(+)